LLAKQRVSIEPCFSFGNIERNRLDGPTSFLHHIGFTPQPVRTNHIVIPTHLENVRDRLAENIHELWSMNKVSSGWRFGEVSLIYIIKFLMNIFSIGMTYKKFIHV
jgi:ryanodine receptor 2